MEVTKVLHMKGGSNETSYGETAHSAKRALSVTKLLREEAIAEVCKEQSQSSILCMADLGCASGPNTLTAVSELIIASEAARKQFNRPPLQLQVYLNELPGNDFNSMFQTCLPFLERMKKEVGVGECFVAAVPGSFYGRLFPTQSLRFVHSSFALQWLSQVPDGLQSNKRNIYISKTSPTSAIKTYKDQFMKDIKSFLNSRSQEVVKGGRMVLTYCSRSSDDPKQEIYALGILATVLNELVDEGIIQEETLEEFNMPVYHASATEIKEAVEKEGSFVINGIEAVEGGLKYSDKDESDDCIKPSYLAGEIRAVLESLFAAQFGKFAIDEIFQRFATNLEVVMHNEGVLFPHVSISLTKK